MARVLVNGCYDLLHAGHREFLKVASQFGDLTVGLNSSWSIRQLKGIERPYQSEDIRRAALEKLGYKVRIFDGDSAKLVQLLNPEIIVRGHDQTISDEDRKHIVVLLPKFADISTTKIIGDPNRYSTLTAEGSPVFTGGSDPPRPPAKPGGKWVLGPRNSINNTAIWLWAADKNK